MPINPQKPPGTQLVIEILAFPAVQLLDVAGPLQVFSTANERVAGKGGTPPYRTSVIAPGGLPVMATAGLAFAAGPLPGSDTPVHTLIVAGGQGVLQAARDGDLTDWLRARAAGAQRVASVCTGAFLLAASGLLDRRRAVTHWEYCAQLARSYPAVSVQSDPIFVRDGDVWTSAGVTAGIDLSLALVEEDLGREIALACARQLVVFLKRPGGQAQFSAALSLQSSDDRFAALHDWMNASLAQDLSVRRLAAQAGMSERSFVRRYTEATGLTPARAVERLRTEAARQLLLETRLPIKRIAARCGFGSEESFRRSFGKLQSVTPVEYRQRFSK